jgi:hypothetical protein
MRLAHLLHVFGIGLAFLGHREPDEPASCAWHRLLGIGRRSFWRWLHAAEKTLRGRSLDYSPECISIQHTRLASTSMPRTG